MMARGAQKTGENNANAGYQGSQQYNTQLENQNQSMQNYLLPQYQNLIQNPGYTAAQQNAITTNSTGAAAATYGAASDQAARTAARTGNAASLSAQQDQLAQEKANTMANVNAQNQIQFANAARQDVQSGLAGISGLYGQDQNLLGRALGIPPEYLAQYNAAMKGGGSSWLPSAIGAAGSVAAAAI